RNRISFRAELIIMRVFVQQIEHLRVGEISDRGGAVNALDDLKQSVQHASLARSDPAIRHDAAASHKSECRNAPLMLEFLDAFRQEFAFRHRFNSRAEKYRLAWVKDSACQYTPADRVGGGSMGIRRIGNIPMGLCFETRQEGGIP